MERFFDDDIDCRIIQQFYHDITRRNKIKRLQFKLDLTEAFNFAYVCSKTKGGSVDLEKYQKDLIKQINELSGIKQIEKPAPFWKLIKTFKKPKKRKKK